MHSGDHRFHRSRRESSRYSFHSRFIFDSRKCNVADHLGGPSAAPLESFHLVPLAAVFDAHMIPDRVRVREVAGAPRHRAQRTVPRVVRFQVSPSRRQPRRPCRAQRTLHRPAPRDPRHTPRACQRRGICNADITMLLNLTAGKPDGSSSPSSSVNSQKI